MKQIIQNFKTGEMTIEEIPNPVCRPGGILIKTAYSLISAGTEKQIIDLSKKSYLGKAKERPDLVKQVINKVKNEGLLNTYKNVMNKIESPMPLGYSCVGQVIEVGREVDNVKVGDYVACAGAGYANHAQINFIPKNLFVKLSDKSKLDESSFTTIGAIAMQGIRQANVSLGDNVAVIGLGLLGQITTQILKAAGCKVIGFEYEPAKIELAKKCGIHRGVALGKEDPITLVNDFTNGFGVDKVIITASTKENEPVELAAEIARDRAIIVMIGVTGMDLPRKPYYEKELEFKFSRSYGPGRYDYWYEDKGIDYPIGYVRWTEARNMEEFVRLVEENAINIKQLITHEIQFSNAIEAYRMITENPNNEKFIGVTLKYDFEAEADSKICFSQVNPVQSKNHIGIGIIGAGNFTQSVLLPEFSKIKGIRFDSIASAKGMHAKKLAEKYHFNIATSNYKDVIGSKNSDLVVITSTHDLHYSMVKESLEAGKNVYVEKPLCIKESELEAINALMVRNNKASLMVGFNRRFSKHIQYIKKFLESNTTPIILNYRVNAGNIPKKHWINDPDIGGGRIIGEVCHFVDLAQYIIGSRPVQVYTQKMSTNNEDIINEDNIITTITYQNGSIASIMYTSVGDKSYPKEKMEIFSGGKVVNCENFRATNCWDNGKVSKLKTAGIDKGFNEFYSQYVKYLQGSGQEPISYEDIYTNTLTTFKIKESLSKETPLRVF